MIARPLNDSVASRLGAPRHKLEIPDAGVDYLTINGERRLTLAKANKVTDRMPVAATCAPSGIRKAISIASDLFVVIRALGRDCHPGDSIISRQPADMRRHLDAINKELP